MKSDKLIDAIGALNDDIVLDSLKPNLKAKRNKKITIAACVASVLALVITATVLLAPDRSLIVPNIDGSSSRPTQSTPALNIKDCEILKAAYPSQAQYPKLGEFDKDFEDAYDKWKQDYDRRKKEYVSQADLSAFLKKSIPQMLLQRQGENTVYSPLNVYMALGILAEITEGESREQILSLLGAESIQKLRQDTKILWNQNFNDDGRYTSILASSLWLSDSINFKEDTISSVVRNYYASTFGGKMGSDELNSALQQWLNEQTGGLLKDQIGSLKLYPETILSIATTLYFKAGWDHFFNERNTKKQPFYLKNGEIECDFLNGGGLGEYFYNDDFSAVNHAFTDGGGMWFILPDKDKTPEEIIGSDSLLDFIATNGEKGAYKREAIINLSVPKFDVSSQLELNDALKELGVTDVFDMNKSDFSPLTDDTDVAVSSALHGARVKIDEEGCTAAAYTVIQMAGSAFNPAEPIDFVVDRPFVFVITSPSGLPLFTGIVNTPN